jgi:hypothetical protein
MMTNQLKQTRSHSGKTHTLLIYLLAFCIGIPLAACNSKTNQAPKPAESPPAESESTKPPNELVTTPSSPPISNPRVQYPSSTPREAGEVEQAPPPIAPPAEIDADTLFGEAPTAKAPPKPTFEAGKIRAAGIRKIESKHLVLYTDLPPSKAIDQLPMVFDLAVPQWCEYFEIDPAKAADWQLIGCLIQEKNRFAGAGLFPSDLPDFPHGYHRDWQSWVYKQPSEYYDRHLVLHEGTHAFMRSFLGGAGPPWFMEGMAEYLGTHRWDGEQLTLGYMPRDNDEVPYWGRVKIIQDDFAANRGQSLQNVLEFGPQAHRRTEAYAWSWAAVTLLAEHPLSKQAFREMFAHVKLPAQPFAERLKHKLGDTWPKLVEQWQLLVADMQYGYDVPRNAIRFAAGQPLPAAGAEVAVDATHGWQSSGYTLRAGSTYKITATGSYTLATDPKPWISEPGGVTIRYYDGRPLGMLLGASRPDLLPDGAITPLATPGAIGLEQEVTPNFDGVLYLSINEDPAQWADNSGSLTVRIELQR